MSASSLYASAASPAVMLGPCASKGRSRCRSKCDARSCAMALAVCEGACSRCSHRGHAAEPCAPMVSSSKCGAATGERPVWGQSDVWSAIMRTIIHLTFPGSRCVRASLRWRRRPSASRLRWQPSLRSSRAHDIGSSSAPCWPRPKSRPLAVSPVPRMPRRMVARMWRKRSPRNWSGPSLRDIVNYVRGLIWQGGLRRLFESQQTSLSVG